MKQEKDKREIHPFEQKYPLKERTIIVAGVTFTAEQVKKVTLQIDGREIYIDEEDSKKRIGF